MAFLDYDEDPFGDEDPFKIYEVLYAPLVAKYGRLDDTVLSSPMMMFGMSFCMRQDIGLFVTYEPYHLIETRSREGLRFALFMAWVRPPSLATEFLTELAEWVLENEIGDGDRIDISGFETENLPSDRAAIRLFSRLPEGYGLFEVKFSMQ